MGFFHLIFCFAKCSPDLKKYAKPITINILLLTGMMAYSFLGGWIFFKLEWSAAQTDKQNTMDTIAECVENWLSNSSLKITKQMTSYLIARDCFPEEKDNRKEWSWIIATLYGFGILTTLGYGRIEPRTTTGRLFCVLFGLVGIPIVMITLANFGKYLHEMVPKLRNTLKKLASERVQRRNSVMNVEIDKQQEEEDAEFEMTSMTLIVMLVVYVAVGAALLPLLNGQFDFLNGIYFTFLCLAAIEFGALVPENTNFLPITLLYVCVGLAITTIALDIGADYVKKLHFIGRKFSNVGSVRIWFGGKTMRVRELLDAVGNNWGVDPSFILDTDLEEIINVAMRVKEGKLPPKTYVRRAIYGIWPPELLPILVKEGGLPGFADETASIVSIPPEPPSISPPFLSSLERLIQARKKSNVRFKEEVEEMAGSTTTEASTDARYWAVLSPDNDKAGGRPANHHLERDLMTASQDTSELTSSIFCRSPIVSPNFSLSPIYEFPNASAHNRVSYAVHGINGAAASRRWSSK
uniref:Potassium channel domain-containing protein n=1 Tax=Plectus sambesii TaxID=2011161 RepID=A0A914V684_9BILA